MESNYVGGGLAEILSISTSDEKRRSQRVKLRRVICVQCRTHGYEFSDLEMTDNISHLGLYFITQRQTYFCGMKLEFTLSDSRHAFLEDRHTGEVVRVVNLPGRRVGVGVRLFEPLEI